MAFLTGVFERYADTPRNDPCPCASGRKYKVCCAIRPRVDDVDRLRWLERKLYEFAAQADRLSLFSGLVGVALEAADHDDNDDIGAFVGDDFFLDLAAFELSMDDFARRYEPMLPEYERDLLDRWRQVPRRLWEVIEANPATGDVVLRDGRTGETARVVDATEVASASTGDLVLARVVDAFGRRRVVGVTRRVDPRHRDSLTATLAEGEDAEQLAAWYGTVIAAADADR
jgi:hypothetical protein